MSAQVFADASDYLVKARAIRRLPVEIRSKAFRRAFRHTRGKVLTLVARRLAAYTGLPYGKVRPLARLGFGMDDGMEIAVRSKWIPLIDLGGVRQTKKGVSTRLRGSYRSAWIATMKSKGVFVREGAERGPVDELYGPNPAHAMGEDRHGEFQRLAGEIMERDLADRIIHELDFILSSA